MGKGKAKTIWLNPPLERVMAGLEQKNGRAGQFSRRIGDIAERYNMIISETEPPELTTSELSILGDALCSTEINNLSMKYMHENILASTIGTEEERKNLSRRAEKWSIVEKIAILEKVLHL
ncbi:MAG: hypothetical protein RR420_08490 [Anaerovoracaceae bacterium]